MFDFRQTPEWLEYAQGSGGGLLSGNITPSPAPAPGPFSGAVLPQQLGSFSNQALNLAGKNAQVQYPQGFQNYQMQSPQRPAFNPMQYFQPFTGFQFGGMGQQPFAPDATIPPIKRDPRDRRIF